jgi:hypothetical protein
VHMWSTERARQRLGHRLESTARFPAVSGLGLDVDQSSSAGKKCLSSSPVSVASRRFDPFSSRHILRRRNIAQGTYWVGLWGHPVACSGLANHAHWDEIGQVEGDR